MRISTACAGANNQYLRWAAARLPSVCFGREVDEITFDGAFVARIGAQQVRARHLVLSTGPKPKIPSFARSHLGRTVFHACEFLQRRPNTTGRTVAVIGGGQSGAEIVAQLLKDDATLPRKLYWITRRPNFLPLDESPFVNELFTPSYVDHFAHLSRPIRQRLLRQQKLASDGIGPNLLRTVHQRLYEIEFLNDVECECILRPARELVDMSGGDGTWQLTLRDLLGETVETFASDYVLLSTGFAYGPPTCLAPLVDRIALAAGDFQFHSDYSVQWERDPHNKIFAQNTGNLAWGIADPNLSLLAWRAARIANSILERSAYQVEHDVPLIEWREHGRQAHSMKEQRKAPASQGSKRRECVGGLRDVVVVGAGIIGTLIACRVVEDKPSAHVLLVDRAAAGSGATRHSLGFDLPYGRTAYHRLLSEESAKVYSRLRAQTRSLAVGSIPTFVVAAHDRMEHERSNFIVPLLPADRAVRDRVVESGLCIGQNQGIWGPIAGSEAIAEQVVLEMVRHFRKTGSLEVWEGAEIDNIEQHGEIVHLGTSDGRMIRASRAALAVGPWFARPPGRKFAEPHGIRVKKILAFHIDKEPEPDAPAVFLLDHDAFLLPSAIRGRLLFSFTCATWDCFPDGCGLKVTKSERALGLSILEAYFPSLVPRCSGARVFCDAYSPDWIQLLPPIPLTRTLCWPALGQVPATASGQRSPAVRRAYCFANSTTPSVTM